MPLNSRTTSRDNVLFVFPENSRIYNYHAHIQIKALAVQQIKNLPAVRL